MKTTLSLLRLLPLRSILSTNFTRFFHGIDFIFRFFDFLETFFTCCHFVLLSETTLQEACKREASLVSFGA